MPTIRLSTLDNYEYHLSCLRRASRVRLHESFVHCTGMPAIKGHLHTEGQLVAASSSLDIALLTGQPSFVFVKPRNFADIPRIS